MQCCVCRCGSEQTLVHVESLSGGRGRMHVRKSRRGASVALAALLMLAGGSAGSVHATDSDSLIQAIEQARPLVDVRMRFEDVGQEGKPETAEAVTARARLGFETGKAWDTALLAEAVLLTPLDTDYNSTLNHKTRFPTVPDPETYDLNRLQLLNTSLPDTTLILGRQRINLDDQRFVGSVNWRQLEQTFDAFQVINRSLPGLIIDLTYANQVNRVFGRNSPVGRYKGDNYLVNTSYQTALGKIVGFAYITDFDLAPTDSTQTYGARFTGSRAFGDYSLGYSASYARQHGNANNPLKFHDDYYQAELSASRRGASLAAGIEILDGNGIKGFTAPLGTLHKFQGWVDQFLTTPPNGIDDRYASLAYTRKALGFLDSATATVVYHDFRSERLDIGYGSEIDGLVQATVKQFTVLLKYGDYRAHHFATDTHKLWLELDYIL